MFYVITFVDLPSHYLGETPLPLVNVADTVGWRPWMWTPNLGYALQFGSAAAADVYARQLGYGLREAYEQGMLQVASVQISSPFPPRPGVA